MVINQNGLGSELEVWARSQKRTSYITWLLLPGISCFQLTDLNLDSLA